MVRLIQEAVAYFFVRLGIGLLRCLGFREARSFCIYAARLAMILDVRHRRMAERNLREAIARDRLQADPRQVIRRMSEHLGSFCAEFAFIPIWVRRKRLQYSVRHPERLWKALDRGRGVILFTGHIGNWELAALEFGLHNFPICTVTRKIKNRFLDAYLSRVRLLGNHMLLPQHGTLDRFAEVLRQKKILAVLIDQRTASHGFVVDFFGRPALATLGPALLAQRYNSVMLPVKMHREGRRHVATFGEPIEPSKYPRSREGAMELAQECAHILEGYIREHPGQWSWLYRRWLIKPDVKTFAAPSVGRNKAVSR